MVLLNPVSAEVDGEFFGVLLSATRLDGEFVGVVLPSCVDGEFVEMILSGCVDGDFVGLILSGCLDGELILSGCVDGDFFGVLLSATRLDGEFVGVVLPSCVDGEFVGVILSADAVLSVTCLDGEFVGLILSGCVDGECSSLRRRPTGDPAVFLIAAAFVSGVELVSVHVAVSATPPPGPLGRSILSTNLPPTPSLTTPLVPDEWNGLSKNVGPGHDSTHASGLRFS